MYDLKNFLRSVNSILPTHKLVGLEEPLKDPYLVTSKDLARLGVDVYLDESLVDVPGSRKLIEYGYHVVVKLVKPMHVIYYQIKLAKCFRRKCVVQDLSMINNVLRCNLGLASLLGRQTLTEANCEFFLDLHHEKSSFRLLIENGDLNTSRLKSRIFDK